MRSIKVRLAETIWLNKGCNAELLESPPHKTLLAAHMATLGQTGIQGESRQAFLEGSPRKSGQGTSRSTRIPDHHRSAIPARLVAEPPSPPEIATPGAAAPAPAPEVDSLPLPH